MAIQWLLAIFDSARTTINPETRPAAKSEESAIDKNIIKIDTITRPLMCI